MVALYGGLFDRAVHPLNLAEAYGWAEDWRAGKLTGDDNLLARLFRLDEERAASQYGLAKPRRSRWCFAALLLHSGKLSGAGVSSKRRGTNRGIR